ncbi:Signal transduction histidine kinase [Microbacterium sp. ru370.1]|uniref:sensor histidine kinase n=1 Tax=unclassified Microbacterium TaxID=2609290 RepID=UPI000885960D|nr:MULTISPECIES: ATP-binding protein [unclassified Microbacterium]SDO51897.1 Signal transduction histidine kinase [Microbacterium sp. ru370.1]SIT83646.1 Signal transduction histidine kinase [Microbacterium sp. RU1D]
MTAAVAETERSVLGEAWGRIPHTRESQADQGTFTQTRIERVITLIVGPGSLVLGAQAFVAAFGPGDEAEGWHTPLVLAVFLPLLAMVIACSVGRFARVFSGVFAIVFVLALMVWPVATAGGPAPAPTENPWIFYLINVATVSTIVAFPLVLQIVWTVATPLLFGVVRLLQAGGQPDFVLPVALDVTFALILGSVLLTLGWMYRSIAANVDQARAVAVSSYASAAATAATEHERVAVAALMHDSVLGALLAAERASSPRERTLAVSMAREALTRLANAEKDSLEGSDEPVPALRLADDIEVAARELGIDLVVTRTVEEGTPRVPGRVARALVLAAMQAVANAVQHADAQGLTVELTGDSAPGGVAVRVRDTGPGFDVAAIPADRLGIRGSINARLAAVGGRSDIDSTSAGTTVTLEWESGDRW